MTPSFWEGQIQPAIVVLEEDGLPPVAALGHVVGEVSQGEAGQTGHCLGNGIVAPEFITGNLTSVGLGFLGMRAQNPIKY